MKNTDETVRHRLLYGNPLLVSLLGLSGAVVFTRDIPTACVAAVTALAVLSAATAASYLFRRYAGMRGFRAVFFSTAAAVTALCAVLTGALLPSVWNSVGACYPLFPVGSLALMASRERGKLAERELDVAVMTGGYGAAIILIAAVRQIFSFLPFSATPAAALLTAGVLAAALRALPRIAASLRAAAETGATAVRTKRRALREPEAAAAAGEDKQEDADGQKTGTAEERTPDDAALPELDPDFWIDPDEDMAPEDETDDGGDGNIENNGNNDGKGKGEDKDDGKGGDGNE